MNRSICVLSLFIALLSLLIVSPTTTIAAKKTAEIPVGSTDKLGKANAVFDADKMSDMSDFDPATWVSPKGDTIKIAIIASFSGPAQINGQFYWSTVTWVAHDINKRGGIWVDGKKKLIEVLKGDTQGRPEQAMKVTERMILQDKVHAIWGTDGSHIMKVINQVANKHKVIALNAVCTADEMQDAQNFGRYSFQGSFSSDQVARGLAYYYGQIRKKEKKFYILCQDYAFGRIFSDGFKKGLNLYYPEAQIVGEDYHKLFLTDFAPYLSKVKGSGAEVIFTGDWVPDAANLAKQAQNSGINLPFANIWMTEATMLHDLGPNGGNGWVHVGPYHSPVPFSAAPAWLKLYTTYHNQWKNFKTSPYNNPSFEHGVHGVGGAWIMQTYWLLSVIERARTTNPEKIIELWEGDTYLQANGKVIKMRACDHKVIQDLSAEVYGPPAEQRETYTIPPYYWYKNASFPVKIFTLPAESVLPWMDQELDRCKGKNDWGE